MYLHHGTRQRVLECRRRVRRTRVMLRGASASIEAQAIEEINWSHNLAGPSAVNASADTSPYAEESATNDCSPSVIAEVDHFHPLRAR